MSSLAVDEVLLILKVLFLVLLYLFIWRIVRSVSRDFALPQESFILRPGEGAPAAAAQPGRLVVVKSPALDIGTDYDLNSSALTIGRGPQNDVQLDNDDFASARHARVEPRRDGVWVQDRGSTNGTFVNGARLSRPRRLTTGDIVRVGESDFRFEQ